MKVLRYILVVVVCLVFLMSGFSNVLGDSTGTGDDILIVDYTSDIPRLEVNQPYNSFEIILQNASSETLYDINVFIDGSASSFTASSENNPEPIDDLKKEDSPKPVELGLKYKGTGNTLTLLITYKKGDNKVDGRITRTITGIMAEEKPDPTPTPGGGVDHSTLIPRITVDGDMDMPLLKAGVSTGLELPLVNSSTHTARDIRVSIDFGSLNTYIIPESVKLVQEIVSLSPGKEEIVDFPLRFREDTPAGVYPVTLNCSCKNVFGKSFEYPESIFIRVENSYSPPDIYIGEIETEPAEIVPGEDVSIKLKLYNSGTAMAKNVRVQLTGLKQDGLWAQGAGDSKNIGGILGNGMKIVGFNLAASRELTGTSCPIGFKFEYEDAVGNEYDGEYETYLDMKDPGDDGEALLNFKDILLSSSSVVPGNTFDVAFRIANTGESKAENIEVWIEGGQGMITKSLTPLRVKSLEAGDETELTFTMLTDTSLKGRQPMAIKAKYTAGGRQTAAHDITQYIEVEMADDEAEKTVPRIIIESYSFEPEVVKAGTAFVLKMNFHNTNRDIAVRNIKVSLISGDGTFTPQNTSNTFYIEGISPQDTVVEDIKLYPKADATPKLYPVELKMEYEDTGGEQYTASETLNITLRQEPRLQTSDFSIAPQLFVGQGTPMYVDFYNMGKSTLYNLMVKLEGDFGGDNISYFAGNFDPGRSDYYEGIIVPEKPGEVKGALVFEFEDETGQSHRVEKEFTTTAQEMQPMDPGQMEGRMPPEMMMPGMEQGEDSQTPTWIYIAAGAGLFVLLIVFLLIRRKRKRASEGMLLNE